MKRRNTKMKSYAMGTGLEGLLGQAPGIIESLLSLTQGQQKPSNQPIVNAQTIKGMATPYSNQFAFGGLPGGDDPVIVEPVVGKTKRKMRRELATPVPNNYGMYNGVIGADGTPIDVPTTQEAIQTMIQYMQKNTPASNVYRPGFSHHSINVSPKTLNPTVAAFGGTIDDLDPDELAQVEQAATDAGISVEEAFAQMTQEQADANGADDEGAEAAPDDEQAEGDTSLADEFFDDGQQEQTDEEQYAMGGTVEAEGKEVVQTPDGRVRQLQGPSHENGGIDIDAPKGTKIYSNRLAIDGKTMQARKLERTKRLGKMSKALGIDPTDAINRNTMERSTEIETLEEQQDMAMQKAANRIYKAPMRKKGFGGKVDKYPFGGEPISDDSFWDALGIQRRKGVADSLPSTAPVPQAGATIKQPTNLLGAPTAKTAATVNDSTNPFTVGDYVGMAGNLFNTIAPIINTNNAARATKPNINRFKSFGQKAIETNDFAQTFVGAEKADNLQDLETGTNTALARNRNSATGVNTVRALDAATLLAKNKGRSSIAANASKQMLGVLGQRSQLENIKDNMVARGATARDTEDKADSDNYYSNMASNLVNAGTNIQGLGKNLNTTQRNSDDMDLMALMTKNGIRIKRKNGKYTLANN